MDFGNPAAIVSAMFIGLVGMALFMYGRKQESPRALLAGAAMCVYPCVITSVLAMWAIFFAVVAALWWSRE